MLEINSSGVGYTLHGTVMSPCSGFAYVDGVNTKDGNNNRFIYVALMHLQQRIL